MQGMIWRVNAASSPGDRLVVHVEVFDAIYGACPHKESVSVKAGVRAPHALHCHNRAASRPCALSYVQPMHFRCSSDCIDFVCLFSLACLDLVDLLLGDDAPYGQALARWSGKALEWLWAP